MKKNTFISPSDRPAGSDEISLLGIRTTDWFRGIAALMVVASHYAEWWAWFIPTEGNAELFRLALTKLGGYGVSLFFLFSGYGLVKSLQGRESPTVCTRTKARRWESKMNLSFVARRLEKVYLPYLLIVGILELVSGGFSSPGKLWAYLSGYDYWYMMVLFLLYLGFILLWLLPCPKPLRILLLGLYTFLFSLSFYEKGMQSFWYTSNFAFVLGVAAAEYEAAVQKLVKSAGPFLIALSALAMIPVVRSGLGLDGRPPLPPEDIRLVWQGVGAETLWTLFILFLAAVWKPRGRFIPLLGRNSLFIYLIHTFVFMRCVNLLPWGIPARFAAGAFLTVLLSLLCGLAIKGILRLLPADKAANGSTPS